jgi:hypothetical protein
MFLKMVAVLETPDDSLSREKQLRFPDTSTPITSDLDIMCGY